MAVMGVGARVSTYAVGSGTVHVRAEVEGRCVVLKLSDVLILRAMLAGVSHPRHIGRRVGLDTIIRVGASRSCNVVLP